MPADHGGEVLFPHFVNHYHQLGITYRRMLVLVHHDPEKYERGALERIMGMCHGYGLECKVWEGAWILRDALAAEETPSRMVELGAGCGLVGLSVAVPC